MRLLRLGRVGTGVIARGEGTGDGVVGGTVVGGAIGDQVDGIVELITRLVGLLRGSGNREHWPDFSSAPVVVNNNGYLKCIYGTMITTSLNSAATGQGAPRSDLASRT